MCVVLFLFIITTKPIKIYCFWKVQLKGNKSAKCPWFYFNWLRRKIKKTLCALTFLVLMKCSVDEMQILVCVNMPLAISTSASDPYIPTQLYTPFSSWVCKSLGLFHIYRLLGVPCIPIACNTTQYRAIPCHTMQYHVIL